MPMEVIFELQLGTCPAPATKRYLVVEVEGYFENIRGIRGDR